MTGDLSAPNEDYLERTFELIRENGYVRVSDIAERLSVTPASVTNMLQKLERDGYIRRQAYRGFTLTEKGSRVGRSIRRRHAILESFLTFLQVPPEVAAHDIDGLEHHLSEETVTALEAFLKRRQR